MFNVMANAKSERTKVRILLKAVPRKKGDEAKPCTLARWPTRRVR